MGPLYLILQYFYISLREIIFILIDLIGTLNLISQSSLINLRNYLYLSDPIRLFELFVFLPPEVQELFLHSKYFICLIKWIFPDQLNNFVPLYLSYWIYTF